MDIFSKLFAVSRKVRWDASGIRAPHAHDGATCVAFAAYYLGAETRSQRDRRSAECKWHLKTRL
jgi:hypothetical protein